MAHLSASHPKGKRVTSAILTWPERRADNGSMGVDLEHLWRATVAQLGAQRLSCQALGRIGGLVRPRVIALGKAAGPMAWGAHEALGELRGVVAANTAGPLPPGVKCLLGSHPVPDAASEAAGRTVLDEAASIIPDEPALFLVSGGGSAIAAVPAAGLALDDKTATTRALLRAGAPIEEMNAVRKHLSALKAGQLGAAARARRRVCLVLCDVPSGDLSSVASGPTVGDPTTFSQCLEIAARAGLALPERAWSRLQAGSRGEVAETPKPGDPRLAGIEHVLLAAPADLALTAARLAGEPCQASAEAFSGPVEALAEQIVALLRAPGPPRLFALAGEPTLRVPPTSGSGGRMQHLALLLSRRLAGVGFEAVCAGSDGRDGDTGHAGARVSGETAARARAIGLDLDAAIARFDSAAACAALGAALPAFQSGTNLCDLVLARRS